MGENITYDQDTKEQGKSGVMEPALAYQYEQDDGLDNGQNCGLVNVQNRGKDGAQNKTIADYRALPEERRVELMEGMFYDMASPTALHQSISNKLAYQLQHYISGNDGKCMVFAAPMDVQLFGDEKTMLQPDLFVMCNRDQILQTRIFQAPDFVIEIASRSNWSRDTVLKLRLYREAGVREYWIVFPEEQKVQVYLFEKHNGENNIAPIEYTFDDKVPVGIWNGGCEVDFAEIYEELRFLYDSSAQDFN